MGTFRSHQWEFSLGNLRVIRSSRRKPSLSKIAGVVRARRRQVSVWVCSFRRETGYTFGLCIEKWECRISFIVHFWWESFPRCIVNWDKREPIVSQSSIRNIEYRLSLFFVASAILIYNFAWKSLEFWTGLLLCVYVYVYVQRFLRWKHPPLQ